MAKPPRKPRELKRGTDAPTERVASRAFVPRAADPRQAGLFDATPGWIAPCLPTLVQTPPSGPDWSHEIKHDGYRTVCVVDRGKVSIFTRRGHDWSSRMPGIAQALAALKLRSAVIDGEAVMIGADGISDFLALHAALASRSAPAAVLMAFDILHLDGEDMRGAPLEERRAILAGIVRKPSGSSHRFGLRLSEEIGGDGATVYRADCEVGLEGIVSKLRTAPYISGRVRSWRKTKCIKTEHFAVIGAPPTHGPARSLKLARLVDEGGALVPCGSAGSGLNDSVGWKIRAVLDAGHPVVAEIEHRGFTSDGQFSR